MYNSPPILVLKATPAPQTPLSLIIAISPAQDVPCPKSLNEEIAEISLLSLITL